MELTRKEYICRSCGSHNIEFNGYAFWDMKKQKLEWSETSRTYCCSCDSEDEEREEILTNQILLNVNTL